MNSKRGTDKQCVRDRIRDAERYMMDNTWRDEIGDRWVPVTTKLLEVVTY